MALQKSILNNIFLAYIELQLPDVAVFILDINTVSLSPSRDGTGRGRPRPYSIALSGRKQLC